ncbi:MAG: diacylglycerol/lipid kinase family protein, partial [Chthoniobacteraceae bacterium]
FQNLGYLDIARYLGHVLVGQHTRLSDVQYFQASKLHVSSEDQVPVEADGELAAELPVQFEVAGKKLRVVVPERPVPEGKRASPVVKME